MAPARSAKPRYWRERAVTSAVIILWLILVSSNGGLSWTSIGLAVFLVLLGLAWTRRTARRVNAWRQSGDLFQGFALLERAELARSPYAKQALRDDAGQLLPAPSRVPMLVVLDGSGGFRFYPEEPPARCGVEHFAVPGAAIQSVAHFRRPLRGWTEVTLTTTDGTLVFDVQHATPLLDELAKAS